ncbi:MAG TPA: AraC family transcriptional regulator [Bacilli bacterium]
MAGRFSYPTSPNSTKARKDETPALSRTVQTESEIRIELPFHRVFDNLAYIGLLVEETWHISSHFHDHFELCYVEEGNGWFAVDDYLYEVSSGDLFLTKPGEGHQGAAAGDLPYRLYYMGFKLEEMRSMEADFYNIGIHRVAKDDKGLIKSVCDAIFAEIRLGDKYSRQMVQGLFMQMLVSVLRTFQEKMDSTVKAPITLAYSIRQVLDLLNTKEGYQMDTEGLAKRVNISRSHLDREFKRFMGISTGKYIRLLTIDRAKHYLRETSDSVTAISQTLNFESIHHFSIFFKRHTGTAPQDFRKLVK